MTQAQNKRAKNRKRVFLKLLFCSLSTCEGSLPSILSLSPPCFWIGRIKIFHLWCGRGDVTARNGINQVQLSHHPGPFATARETNRRTASDSDARLLLLLGPKEYCVCLSSWY
ncbi:hypothetical protein CDAR_177891 [Caerostris darwini]|uniref:Secreted protein n=1 Tax=Caerostris darwini TaxID=1538125 RepID=A0AAV4WEJ1_9ARAC|nr:hypothetical protein CDAR_177891 [Caerostris darwini]